MTYPTIHPAMLPELNLSDPVAKANILLNAFRVAINGGLSVFNMVDGVADEFEDETGVTTKTGATYDAANDLYHNEASGYTADVINTFTGYTSGDQTISSINDTVPEEAWRAVDKNGSTNTWQSYPTVWPEYLTLDFGSGNAVAAMQYTITARASDLGRMIGTWTFQYSDDGSAYTTVDTRSGVTWSTPGEKRTYNGWAAAGAHRYWRLRITGNADSNYPSVAEWEIMETVIPPDMTLISDPFTADAEPDEGFIVVWEEDVDAVTLNTDLKAYVSIDNGNNWDLATLTEAATLDTGRILIGTADVSTRTGTAMLWKVTTHNNKQLKVHAVGLEWS
jgi:hypothetical protein